MVKIRPCFNDSESNGSLGEDETHCDEFCGQDARSCGDHQTYDADPVKLWKNLMF